MRRKDKEITKKAEIESILKEAQVCRIGMLDGRRPYVVPVCYAYKDGVVFFHSSKEGKKMVILRNNPGVCFETEVTGGVVKSDTPCRFGMEYRSVVGYGKAVFIKDDAEKRRALNRLMEKYSGGKTFDYPGDEIDKVAVIRIVIEEMTGKRSGYL